MPGFVPGFFSSARGVAQMTPRPPFSAMPDVSPLLPALTVALREAALTEHPQARAMARQGLRLLARSGGPPVRRACLGSVRRPGRRLHLQRDSMPSPQTRAALEEAIGMAREGPPRVAALAASLAAVAPHQRWVRRPGRPSGAFRDGHANAWLIGSYRGRGLAVGISLMAPGLRYPDHRHPPRELYFVLAGGGWWREGQGWSERRAGQWIHNPPGVLHAMRSGPSALLAVWFLRLDGR